MCECVVGVPRACYLPSEDHGGPHSSSHLVLLVLLFVLLLVLRAFSSHYIHCFSSLVKIDNLTVQHPF